MAESVNPALEAPPANEGSQATFDFASAAAAAAAPVTVPQTLGTAAPAEPDALPDPPPEPVTDPGPAPEPARAAAAAARSAPRPYWLVRRLTDFARLMRLDRPIGIWLLLWPTLWALWIASRAHPPKQLLLIFLAGTVLMRSAGCIINDLSDRNIDPHVKRTRMRPLAARLLTPNEALALFSVLALACLALVLQLNALTVRLAFIGAALTVTYPLLKRFFPLPQLYLGLCFGWGVPMAFAATLGAVPRVGWLMLVANVLWTGVYDTMYAMVDRDDDVRVGVQSSAILFADLDRLLIGVMQIMTLMALWLIGRTLHFGVAYDAGLVLGALCFLWQQWLIRHRERMACFAAFQDNNYFGIVIFAGILLEYSSR